jgi:hypothetical protein
LIKADYGEMWLAVSGRIWIGQGVAGLYDCFARMAKRKSWKKATVAEEWH